MQAIHSVQEIKQGDGVSAFVGLEVADEMPAQIAGTIRNLSLGFLYAIFAKERDATIGGFVDDGGREFFTHRDELHILRRASGAVAGGCNAFLNGGQVVGDIRHAGMLV